MTEHAKVFISVIKSVCWTNGWGTNGTTRMYPNFENGKELSWLVDNGYLFHFQKRETHSRYKVANNSMSDRYGITSKGWNVAGRYIDCAGVELEYQQPYFPKRKS